MKKKVIIQFTKEQEDLLISLSDQYIGPKGYYIWKLGPCWYKPLSNGEHQMEVINDSDLVNYALQNWDTIN